MARVISSVDTRVLRLATAAVHKSLLETVIISSSLVDSRGEITSQIG